MKISSGFKASLYFSTVLFVASSGFAASNYPTPYAFSTLAGVSSIGAADGTGSAARFNGLAGVATDRAGNIYLADGGNSTVRKITPAGVVTTMAGAAGQSGSADGTGSAARFVEPSGIAVDAAGNLYVSDIAAHTIRKISPTGVVMTFAGASGQSGNTDGTGNAARFMAPEGLAVDGSGNVFVADSADHALRKISPAGGVTTLLRQTRLPPGLGGDVGHENIFPRSVALDPAGNAYIESNSRQSILKVTPNGGATVFCGEDPLKFADGSSHFNGINNVTADAAGNLYVADDGFGQFRSTLIRKVIPNGTVTTLVFSNPNFPNLKDGPLAEAKYGAPVYLAFDPSGVLCAADAGNNVVRKQTTTEVSTLAGLSRPEATRILNASGGNARFNLPEVGAIDGSGNVLVLDDNLVRKISPAGVVTTVADLLSLTSAGGNPAGFPQALTAGPNNSVFVALQIPTRAGVSAAIGLVSATGTLTRVADNPATALALDSRGNLIFSDFSSVRKVAPDGTVTTIAGSESEFGSRDGAGTDARFNSAFKLCLDAADNIYVSDTNNSTIRKITPAGVVTTLAGSPGQRGSEDGVGSAARFDTPGALAVDGSGAIYVADIGNNTVRKIEPNGTVSTLAGLVDTDGYIDGVGRDVRFATPISLAIDRSGTLYVGGGTTIRKGVLAGPPVITTQPQNAGVVPGGNVTFTVAAAAAPAPTFQWFFNNSAIAGATNSTLTINGVREADHGNFTVVVTNELGRVTSAVANIINIAPPPQPGGGSGGGGGGAPSAWFLLTLLALAGLRRFTARNQIFAGAK